MQIQQRKLKVPECSVELIEYIRRGGIFAVRVSIIFGYR